MEKKVLRTAVKDYIRNSSWGKHVYGRPTKPLPTEKRIEKRKRFGKRLINEGSP